MSDRSQAEMIQPPNTLAKAKTDAGRGHLSLDDLDRAERAMQQVGEGFQGLAIQELTAMEAALETMKSDPSQRAAQVREIFRRALDLKGQGASVGFVLISEIGQLLKTFTETLQNVRPRDIEIMLAHISAMKTVLARDIRGDGGEVGRAIVAGLYTLVDRG